MKRVITYLELLQMIKEGNPPKFVKVYGEPYRWNDVGYIDRYDDRYLREMLDLSDFGMAKLQVIEVLE